jgi:4-diphosphocytidyl-2-C-methyl-D-erythritol kinase
MVWNRRRSAAGSTAPPSGNGPARSELAPAKINLDLLVTGRRLDGYHELDSLVVFAPIGDRLEFEPADRGGLSLEVSGPFAAAVPQDESNLVLRAAELLARRTGTALSGRIRLDKRLPVGGGLGGGSADAAAALRLLDRVCGTGLGNARLRELGAELGADVPVCIYARPARMRGLGERLDPVRGLPALALLLVNPGVHVATPQVFRGLRELGEERDGGLQPNGGPLVLAQYLAESRNDLEVPAVALAPVIGKVLQSLRVLDGCLLARMSGSGSSCFGLFADGNRVERAAAILRAAVPGWWIEPILIEPGADS